MRWLPLTFLPVSNACWLYSKDAAVAKIEKELHGRTYIDRSYVYELEKKLPKAVSWAINAIGVDAAFKDCDANQDGKITLEELKHTDTCLTSCAKLAIVNAVL